MIFTILTVFFLAFSIWSGSRSLYLGLTLWLAIYLSFLIRNTGRRELQVALWSAAGLFVFAVILLGYPPLNSRLQNTLNFPSSVRMLKTINWSEAGAQLQSRQAYSKVAYHTWRRSPLTGLGLERFYGEQQRIMKVLQLDLGGWRDNANNFYLQVLAEQGVLGLGMLLVGLTLFAFALLSPERKAIVDVEKIEPAAVQRIFFLARSLMLVVFVVLITGPHLLFDEVRYLTFFLLALALSRPILVRPEILKIIRSTSIATVLLFPALFFVSVNRGVAKSYSTGFYPVEGSGEGEFSWMGDRARLNLCSVGSESVTLKIRAIHPDILHTPVRVALFERAPDDNGPLDITNLQPVRIRLDDTEWHEVTVSLPRGGFRARTVVEIRVDRTWSPARSNQGDDVRALGIMVKWPTEGC